ETIFASLTHMSHCAGMTEACGPFVPHKRSRHIFRNADAVFEHSSEIIHRPRMAAIGCSEIILYCLQSFVPEGKRPAEQEHETRIGRICSKGRSACRLCLRRIDIFAL